MNKDLKIKSQILINIRKMTAKFLVLFSLIFVFISVFASSTQAAELYLESSEGNYYVDETFVINIRINVEHNESINAIEAYLEFPKNILKVVDFSTGNSILTFIEEPKINQEKGLISFVGIIPGGYSGQLIGDPGKSNLLGRIIFSAVSQGSAQIIFQGKSQVLLSDGKGTPAKLISKGVIIEVEPPVEVQPLKDEWQEELEKDKIPPEDFKPEIIKIDDKYYLAFTARDKNSGIDHYEILEFRIWNLEFSKTLRKIFKFIPNSRFQIPDSYKTVESPYVLKDQELQSYIYVKAIDKAGNERIVKLPATYSLPLYKNYFVWVIITLVISLVITKNLWKKLLIH